MCGVWISGRRGTSGWARYHAHGVAGLVDLARRPHTQPHRTPDARVAAIVAMKHRHPSFGPKKIRDRLRAVAPRGGVAVDSTVGAILNHAGLVRRAAAGSGSRPIRRRYRGARGRPRVGVRTLRGTFRWAMGSGAIR